MIIIIIKIACNNVIVGLQGMKDKMKELAKNLGIPNPGALNM
jgi:hypothetical protein